jgi:hypothetical protein
MGLGRYHHLSIPRSTEHGRETEGEIGGMQEAVMASLPTTKPSTTGTATIPISVSRHVMAEEMQGEQPSSGSQETMLPLGLTIVLSSPMLHTPINNSPNAISMHSLSHFSHPSARLTSPQSAYKALAMAHLERTLALVRSAVAKATPSTSTTTQAT